MYLKTWQLKKIARYAAATLLNYDDIYVLKKQNPLVHTK